MDLVRDWLGETRRAGLAGALPALAVLGALAVMAATTGFGGLGSLGRLLEGPSASPAERATQRAGAIDALVAATRPFLPAATRTPDAGPAAPRRGGDPPGRDGTPRRPRPGGPPAAGGPAAPGVVAPPSPGAGTAPSPPPGPLRPVGAAAEQATRTVREAGRTAASLLPEPLRSVSTQAAEGLAQAVDDAVDDVIPPDRVVGG